MKKIRAIVLGVLLVILAIHFHRRFVMRKEAKSAWRLVAIIALLVIVARLLGGCVKPSLGSFPRVVEFVDSLPFGSYGLSGCDSVHNIPVSYIRKDLGPTVIAVAAHELRHSLDMKSNCKAFIHNYQTSAKFRLWAETRGYCAGALASEKYLNVDYEALLHEYASFLYWKFSEELELGSPEGMYASVYATCLSLKGG